MTRTRQPQSSVSQPQAQPQQQAEADDQSTLGNAEVQQRLAAQTPDGHPIHDGDVLIPSIRSGEPDVDTHRTGADQGIAPRNASQSALGVPNPDFVGPSQPPLNPYDQAVSDPVPLFDEQGPGYRDPLQGALGDCYLIASLSAVAQQDPGRIRRMVRPMPDGRYVVTFWVAAVEGGVRTFNPHDEIVENIVPSSNLGRAPDYGGTGPAPDPMGLGGPVSQRELWVSLVERAYAQWRGGYDQAGAGGNGAIALEELTGLQSRTLDPQAEDPARIFEQVEEALRARSAVVASTGGDDDLAASYGLFGSHGYSVLSAGPGRMLVRNQHDDPQRGGRRVEVGAEALRGCFVEIAISAVAGAYSNHPPAE